MLCKKAKDRLLYMVSLFCKEFIKKAWVIGYQNDSEKS